MPSPDTSFPTIENLLQTDDPPRDRHVGQPPGLLVAVPRRPRRRAQGQRGSHGLPQGRRLLRGEEEGAGAGEWVRRVSPLKKLLDLGKMHCRPRLCLQKKVHCLILQLFFLFKKAYLLVIIQPEHADCKQFVKLSPKNIYILYSSCSSYIFPLRGRMTTKKIS